MTSLQIQIDSKILKEAQEVAEKQGVTLSEVFSNFAKKIAENKVIPTDMILQPNEPNQQLIHDIQEATEEAKTAKRYSFEEAMEFIRSFQYE